MKRPAFLALLFCCVPVLLMPACAPSATSASAAATPAPVPTAPAAPSAQAKVAAALKKFQTEVDALNADAVTDVSSPAGKKMLADVSQSAVEIGLAYVTGNEAGAVVDGLEGGAAALNDASGLPTVSSSALGKALAAGSGVPTVATKVAPALTQLITLAQSKGGDGYSVAQAVVQGLQAIRGQVPSAN